MHSHDKVHVQKRWVDIGPISTDKHLLCHTHRRDLQLTMNEESQEADHTRPGDRSQQRHLISACVTARSDMSICGFAMASFAVLS